MKMKSIATRKSFIFGMVMLALFTISTMAAGLFISTNMPQVGSDIEKNQSFPTIEAKGYKTTPSMKTISTESGMLPWISTERPIPELDKKNAATPTTRSDTSDLTWDSYQALRQYYRDQLTTEYFSQVQAKLEKERGMTFQKPLIDTNLQKYFAPAMPPELENQRTRVIIVLEDDQHTHSTLGTTRNFVLDSLKSHPSVKIIKTYQKLPIIIVEGSGKDIQSMAQLRGIKAMFEDRFVQLIEPDWKPDKTVPLVPQWFGSEASIGAFALHDLGINGSGVKVAIIDTGIDKTHPDLDDFDNNPSTNDPKVIAEASFVDFDGDGNPDVGPNDDFGHGTHVAGTVAANGNLIGMAPGASLLNAKVLYYGGGMISWIVNGVEWAMQQNADIISMSLGGGPGFPEQLLTSIVEAAWDQGIVVTIAAGNSGPTLNSVSAPGSASKVITVGASDVFNTTIFFSSRGFGPWGRVDPDVVAPGVEILSTLPNEGYGIASGTSMAAPHAAGAAALLLSANPNLSNEDVKRLLIATARDQGEDANIQGAGRIDVFKAYQEMNQHPRVLFPSGKLTITLSPSEQRTVSIDLLTNESVTITPNLTGNVSSLLTWKNLPTTTNVGQTSLTFTITLPSSATSTDVYRGTLNFTSFEGELILEIQVDDTQDDAGTGTDAGDIFIDATPLALGNYSGMVQTLGFFNFEHDIYKFTLTKGKTYVMELHGGFDFFDDLDLLLFDENGTLIAYSGSFTSDERIAYQANYTGTHYLMVYTFFAMESVHYDFSVNEVQGTGIPGIATVNLLGYNDATVDDDNDGLADFLEINVTMEVSVDGTYDVLYVLAENRSDYQVGRYDVAFIWETVDLTAGSPSVIRTRIDGHVLRNTLYDGTYVIGEILIGDPSTFTVLLDEFNVHETASYQHDIFEPLAYYLTDISDSAVDTDADGSNDTLRISVNIQSQVNTIIDSITLPLIITGDWSYVFFVFSSNDSVPLQGGSNTITFDISGEVFGRVNYNGTFIVPYLEFDDFDATLNGFFRYSIWHETGVYNTTSLQQSGFTLAATSDQGVDADSDGLIDYIEISLTFDVTKPARYRVSPASNYLINLEQQRVYFTDIKTPNTTVQDFVSDLIVQFGEQPGRHVVIYHLPTAFLKERGANGTFLIPSFWVTKLQDDFWEIPIMTFNVKTQSYNSATFENPKIQYLNKLWIEKTDAKFNDGVEDSIKLTLAFQVNTPGTYDLLLNVIDHQTWGFWFFDAIVSQKTFNSAGEVNWTLVIDGKRLFLSKTKLSLEILLLQVGTLAVDADPYFYPKFDDLQVKAYSLGLTPLYDWKEFQGAVPVSFTGVVKTTFVDNNTNGQYEAIKVHFEVDVRQPVPPSGILMDFNLMAANGSYYKFDLENVSGFTTVGLHNITLTLESRIFVVFLASDAPYALQVSLWNSTFDYGGLFDTPLIDHAEYLITGLSLADFEYASPVEILAILNDYLPSESTMNEYNRNDGVILLLDVDSAASGSFVIFTEMLVTVETEFYIEQFTTTVSDDVTFSLGRQQVETLLSIDSIFYYPPSPSSNITFIITNVYVSPTFDQFDSVSRWIGEYATNEYSAGDFDYSYGYPTLDLYFNSFTWKIEDADDNSKSDGITLLAEMSNANDLPYTIGFTISISFDDSTTAQAFLSTGPYIDIENFNSATASMPIDSSLIAYVQSLLLGDGAPLSSLTLDTSKDVTIAIEDVMIYQQDSDVIIAWMSAPFDWHTDLIDLANFEIYERANPISAGAPELFNADTDAEYEYLRITITVTVTEPSYYYPVVLYWSDDARSNTAPVLTMRDYAFFLTEGTHDMDLIIEGSGLQAITGSGGYFDIVLQKADDLFDFVDLRQGGTSYWVSYISPNIVSSDIPSTVDFPFDFDPWYDPLFDSDVTDPLYLSSTFEATDTTSGVLTIETFDATKVVVFLNSRAIGDLDGYDTVHDLTLTNLIDGTTYTMIIELLNEDLRVSRRTYEFTFHARTTTTTISPPQGGGFIPGFEWITAIGGLFSLGIALVQVRRRRRQ